MLPNSNSQLRHHVLRDAGIRANAVLVHQSHQLTLLPQLRVAS